MESIDDRLYRYRAKRLRFFINGDKFFTGLNYALNTERVRSFEYLLNDLTRTLSTDHLKLCKGVRFIFSIEGEQILSLADFQDGKPYVCSSTDNFISIEYQINTGILNWLVRNSADISSTSSVRNKRCHNLTNTSNNNNNHNHSNNNNNNNDGLVRHNNTISPNQRLQLTPTTKKTSHDNNNGRGNVSLSAGNNSIEQHSQRSNQSRTPKTNRISPLLAPQSAKVTVQKSPDVNRNRRSTASNSYASPNRTRKSAPNNNGDLTPKTEHRSHNIIPSSKQIDKTAVGGSSYFDTNVVKKYDIGRPIGDGHFSVVYCCMNKASQDFCALKLIDKLKCQGRDEMIYNEIKILQQLRHPNIVKLIESFDFPHQLYLILELVQDGDLFDAITTVTKFEEEHVATMIYNLASALTYLHGQGIVHRDIKPENLLISVHEDGSQSVKLADFGLAVEVGETPLYSVCGTAFYVSPEMLNESGYDYKVDVWSTGVICFILLCGYPPFTSENESNQDELFDAILAGDFQFAPPYWNKISQHAKNLIRSMLTVDPDLRYTAEDVFKHPWTMGLSSNFEGKNPMNISRKIALQSQ